MNQKLQKKKINKNCWSELDTVEKLHHLLFTPVPVSGLMTN